MPYRKQHTESPQWRSRLTAISTHPGNHSTSEHATASPLNGSILLFLFASLTLPLLQARPYHYHRIEAIPGAKALSIAVRLLHTRQVPIVLHIKVITRNPQSNTSHGRKGCTDPDYASEPTGKVCTTTKVRSATPRYKRFKAMPTIVDPRHTTESFRADR